jgi:phosphoketolase
MSSGIEKSPESSRPLSSPEALTPDELQKMDAYWRAANYLSAHKVFVEDLVPTDEFFRGGG